MINDLKNLASKLPSSLLFWSALGGVVASGAVYFIKPVRNSLLGLLGFSQKRKAAVKRSAAQRVHRISRRPSHVRGSRRLAHAVRVR